MLFVDCRSLCVVCCALFNDVCWLLLFDVVDRCSLSFCLIVGRSFLLFVDVGCCVLCFGRSVFFVCCLLFVAVVAVVFWCCCLCYVLLLVVGCSLMFVVACC